MYSTEISQILSKLSISIGDEISYSNGSTNLRGILMPNSDAGDPNCLNIKLPSGYNVGVKMDGCHIKKENRADAKSHDEREPSLPSHTPGVKKIALITTGGTIAAKVDYKTGAVSAKISPSEFLAMYPGLEQIANVEIYPTLNILSENMSPSDWQKIANAAKQAQENGAYGIVITHGTDTMGYTAAALSYALEGIGIPVILTGSQRSPDRPSSDAHQNMKCSFYAAISDISGVYVCMHASTSDDFNYLHPGTRTRKMHTSGRWAFSTIGARPIAKVYPDSKFELLCKTAPRRSDSKPNGSSSFVKNVHLAWAYPGISTEEILRWENYSGVVIAGTGFGHISSEANDALSSLIKKGIPIVMAPQCFEGRLMMQTYSTGRRLEDLGVIGNGCDWLAETAFVKLCWALAQAKDIQKIREIMCLPISGDITPFSVLGSQFNE